MPASNCCTQNSRDSGDAVKKENRRPLADLLAVADFHPSHFDEFVEFESLHFCLL